MPLFLLGFSCYFISMGTQQFKQLRENDKMKEQYKLEIAEHKKKIIAVDI